MYNTLHSQSYLNVGYIDDSYLQGDSKTECRSNVLTSLNLFESLGFLINREKSVLQPCQKLEFLGFLLDSVNMKVFLTADKREKIILACQQLLKKSVTSISLQNRRNFLRISGEQRRARGEREAQVACEGRIAKNIPPVCIPLFKLFRRSNMNAAT